MKTLTTQQGTLGSPLHSKNFQQSVAGNVYIGNAAVAGAVCPIYSNTAQKFGILNPVGSGVYVVPMAINIGYIDTTSAAGGFCIGYNTNCGAGIATGSAGVTAATTATPISARIDGPAARATFMSAGITTAAPSLLMALGLNQLVVTAADATTVPFSWRYEFNDEIVIPPGNAIYLAGIIAVLVKIAPSFMWKEIPIARADEQ
jgi:hypothetical protein